MRIRLLQRSRRLWQPMRNPDERNDPQRPLLEHLTALRDMLLFDAVAWVACVVLACVFSPDVLAWLKSPAAANEELLQGLDLTSGFSIRYSPEGKTTSPR